MLFTLNEKWRILSKNRSQVIISIVSLSLSFACFVFAMYWFTYELNYDSFYPDSKRIYMVNEYYKTDHRISPITPYPLAQKLKADFPEVSEAVFFQKRTVKMLVDKAGLGFAETTMLNVDTSFFRLFPQQFIHGGVDDAFNDGTGIILTESVALQLFGSTKPERQYESMPFSISGVVADLPQNTVLPFETLMLWKAPEGENIEDFGSSTVSTFVLLHKAASAKKLSDKLQRNFLNPELEELNVVFDIVSLSRVKYMAEGKSFIVAYTFQIIVVAASLLLLFSAIFNFVMLTMARFLSRLKVYAIHKIVGAGSWRIAAMLYSEVVLITLIALAVSADLIVMLKPFYIDFTGITVGTSELFFDALKYGAICLFVVLIANLYPVLYVCVFAMRKSLIGSSLYRKAQLSTGLIGAQLIIVMITSFFILGVVHQYFYSIKSDLGFNKECIERVELKGEVIRNNIEPFINELKSNNAIDDIIGCDYDLFGVKNKTGDDLPSFLGEDYKTSIHKGEYVYSYPLMPEVFRFFQMQLKEGKVYTNEQEDGMMSIMVNEELVRKSGLENSVNKIINYRGNPAKIVGVVKNVHNQPMKEAIESIVWINNVIYKYAYNGARANICYFKYKEGRKQEAIDAVRKAYSKYAPGATQPDIVAFPDYLRSFYQEEEQTVVIFSAISIISLIISVVGVYTLVSFKVRQRRKEIVVRKIMGASSRMVMGILLKEYLWLLLVSYVIAIPIGYKCLEYWMQYSYHVTIGLPHLLIVFFVMAAIIFLTVINQVVRLAYINPVEVIKENN